MIIIIIITINNIVIIIIISSSSSGSGSSSSSSSSSSRQGPPLSVGKVGPLPERDSARVEPPENSPNPFADPGGKRARRPRMPRARVGTPLGNGGGIWPVSLLRLSLLRFVDSTSPGNPLWT